MYAYIYVRIYICVCVCMHVCVYMYIYIYETLPEFHCNLQTGQFEKVDEEPVVDWHCKLKRPVRGFHSQSRV
jgi:hypothetical protein